MDVIPAVDVLGGAVVRLRRGDYANVTEYGIDPIGAVLAWMAGGAPIVHVVDLDGARGGDAGTRLWRDLGDAGASFQIGGGIRDEATAGAAVAAGARRVVMGTAAVWEPDVLAAAVAALGPDRVVAAIDVRDGRASGTGWRDEGRPVDEVLAIVGSAGVPRVLVTGITRDGTMAGPDTDLLRHVLDTTNLPVVASGGIGSLDDLRELAHLGAEAAVVGRALYEGRFTLAEAIDAAR